MNTTTTPSLLDSLLRRIKHRSALDLVLPALTLTGVFMAGASLAGA